MKKISKYSNELNLIYGLAGIVAGFWGSQQLAGPEPCWYWGLPLEALAAGLIWIAFPSRIFLPPTQKFLPPPRQAKSCYVRPYWHLLLIIFLAVVGQFFFYFGKLFPALLAWLAALTLGVFFKFSVPGNSLHTSKRLEKIGLILVLLLASLLRFPFVNQHLAGFQIDEGLNIEQAYFILSGKLKSPFAFVSRDYETMPFFYYALAFKCFGQNFVVARALSAVFSLATLYFFYKWCRFHFGFKGSCAATFFMSISWWVLFNSLSPFHTMPVVFFEVLSFYFFEKCLREGSKADFVFLGLAVALGFLGYIPGRLIPVMMALVFFVFTGLNFSRLPKTYFLRFLLSLLFFLWLAGPFLNYAYHDSDEFFKRAGELSLLTEVHRSGNYGLIFQRIGYTLTSFAFTGQEYDERFTPSAGVPVLDPLMGILLYFGLFLSFFNLRKRWALEGLVVFFAGVLANAFAIQGANPNPTYINQMRYFIIAPSLFYFCAASIDQFLNLIVRLRPKKNMAAIIILVLIGGFSVVWNGQLFFVRFHTTHWNWDSLGFNNILVADYTRSIYPQYHILLDPIFDTTTERVLDVGIAQFTDIQKPLSLPFPYKVNRDLMMVFRPGYVDEDEVRRIYPNCVFDQVKNKWGDLIMDTIEISKGDIEASLRGQPPPNMVLP